MGKRPFVLSIAGFDPSAGAGLLADIKTFEANKVYGFAVATSITFQNESEFNGLHWLTFESINSQLMPIFKKYKIQYIKIGLIENLDFLMQLILLIHKYCVNPKIIWDPIIKSATGFEFHKIFDNKAFENIAQKIFMITPNWDEVKFIAGNSDSLSGAEYLSQFCHVYLKGGHNTKSIGRDYLLFKWEDGNKKSQSFRKKELNYFAKHGSGCILSAAITAQLALGYPLPRACLKAKDYVSRILSGNNQLLGYHKI